MNIRELRVGNLVIYEACTYQVMRINGIGKPSLNVKAVNHEWGVEKCGVNEVEGLPIDTMFLKNNGFKMLFKGVQTVWIRSFGNGRYIRYYFGFNSLQFDNVPISQWVPWPILYVHQMQNVCFDYGIDVIFDNV